MWCSDWSSIQFPSFFAQGFLHVLLKAPETLSSPSEVAVSFLGLQNGGFWQPPQTQLPHFCLPLGCGVHSEPAQGSMQPL